MEKVYNEFVNSISTDIERFVLIPKKTIFLVVPLWTILTTFLYNIFSPATIVACVIVGIAWLGDVVAGWIYNTHFKVPPDNFDKHKIFRSAFEFGCLIFLIIMLSFLKYWVRMHDGSNIEFLMKIVDGGFSSIFFIFQLIIFLVLLRDFAERGVQMKMRGAPTLLKYINGMIRFLFKKAGQDSENNSNDNLKK